MPKVPQKTQNTIWIISICAGLLLWVIAGLLWFEIIYLGPITPSDFIAFGIMATIGAPAIVSVIDSRWRDGIDSNLPNLLRDIADAQRTGLSLPRAISQSAKRNYGPLTPELKKMAAKISWGIPFAQAMRSFTETADTELTNRAAILILEAQRSGGVIEEIFESAETHVEDILALRKERLGSMRPYIWIIYAAFVIFLLVLVILFQTFFYPMTSMYENFQDVGVGGQIAGLSPQTLQTYKTLFLHMTLVEGLFSGLVAGKMGEGQAKAGLKHAAVMVLFGWIAYKLTIELQLIAITLI